MTIHSEEKAPPSLVAVSVDWADLSGTPVAHVNQVLAQVGPPAQDGTPDGVYISLGSAEPPLLIGSDEERQSTLEAIGALKATVHGRFHISRGHLRDLIRVLETVAAQHDAVEKVAGSGDPIMTLEAGITE